MAETIRGINVVIGAETTGLGKALDDVDKKSRSIQSELKQVEKSLKLDPTNTILVAQKQQLLGDAINTTKERLERLRSVQDQVEQKFAKGEIGEQRYRDFQRELVKTEQSLKGLERQLEQTGRTAKTLGERVKSASDELTAVGAGVTAAGVAMAAGIGKAVEVAADFEQELSRAKAVSSATADEMVNLKEAAIKMGSSTAFSASEAARAMTELMKGGMSAKQVLDGGLKASLDLAAAGELSMGEAAEYVIKTMGPFSIEADKAGKIANVLAGAANASATDVGEMGQAMSQTATIAAQMGVSMEDTAAALALFANKGIVGSDAGTSLKTMLMRLVPSTDEATKAFQKFGLITADGNNKFFDAQGQLKSLSDVSEILQNTLGGLNAEQQQLALNTIFGSDAIRAAAILTKEGASGFDAMATSIGKISASDVAKEKLNNFNGALKELKGSFEAAAISIGDALIPVMKVLGAVLKNAVDWFNSLSPTMKQIIAISAAVGAALALITGPLLMLAGAIPSIMAGFEALAGVFAGISAGPVAAVVAALIAVGIAIKQLWDENEGFRNKVTESWEQIKTSVSTIVNALVAAFEWFATTTGPFWSGLWETFKSVVGSAIGIILDAVNLFLNILTGNWTGAWENIKSILIGALDIVNTVLSAAWDGITIAVLAAWDGIKSAISGAWDGIVTGTKENLSSIETSIETVWKAISDDTKKQWDELKNDVVGAFQWMYDHNYYFKDLVDTINAHWSKAVTDAQVQWGQVKSITATVSEAVVKDVGNQWNVLKDGTIAIWTTVSQWLSGLWGSISADVSAKWNGIVATLSGVWQRIKDGFNEIITTAKNWGKNLINEFISGIESEFDALGNTMSSVAGSVSDYLGFHSPTKKGPGSDADKWAPNLIDMFADGLQAGIPKLEGMMNGLASALASPVATAGGATQNSYSYGGNTIIIQLPPGSDRAQARELERVIKSM